MRGIGISLGILLGSTYLSSNWAFLPSALFEEEEQGAWYDPSDLTSMRQLSTGATAAAVGSPVGFMADKRLMGGQTFDAFAASQPDIVVNGDFSVDANWVKVNGATISGGTLNLFNAVTNPAATQTINATIGWAYYVEIEWTGTLTAGIGNYGSGDGRFLTGSTAGSFAQVVPLTAGTGINIWLNAPVNSLTTVERVLIKAIPGNHATQVNAAQRPILRQDGALYYLEFDGVDDSLATASINFSATDEMSLFAGMTQTTDGTSCVVETSVDSSANNGAFSLFGIAGTDDVQWLSRGTVSRNVRANVGSKPIIAVYSGLSDVSSDALLLRYNGSQVGSSTGDQGTGNYGNYPLYIGRRAGTSLPFNGRIYSLIVRGKLTSGADLTSAENYVAGKTGVTI